MNSCTCCFTDYLVQCDDFIQVYAQLQPDTTYSWIITDKFDKQYSEEFTTDENGFWQIPTASLPPGLLTEYGGVFSLEVLDQSCKPTKFKIASEYNCIDFSVKAGTRLKNTLGCTFDTVFPGNAIASYYLDTFADMLPLATGNQIRFFTIAADEDKEEANTSYVYNPNAPELIYLGAAVLNSET